MDKKKSIIQNALQQLVQPILAIIVGLIIGGLIILAIKENPIKIYAVMFKGGFGSVYYFLATLVRSIPIIMCGVGAAFAWRAGYINIGGEGQMIVGGFMSTVAALYIPIKGPLGIVIVILVGMLCGGLYALLASWLDERFGVILLISTLMFNYIAHHITSYFVAYPLKDNSVSGITPKTVPIDKSLWLPTIPLAKGTTFNWGFIIAIIAVIVVIFIISKTTFGYESKMSGLNSEFARYGGVKRKKVMYMTMLASGALAGLGGTLEVLGLKHLYMHDMLKTPSYAWTGLMAMLIANLNPVGTVVCSIFLAGLQTGGSALERSTEVPLEVTTIIQAVITLLVSARLLTRVIKAHKRKKAAKMEGGV